MTVAVRKFKVEVVRVPMLVLQYEYFDPERFKPVEGEKIIPVEGTTLTEPTYGPKGGFLHAELKNSLGRTVYLFTNSEQAFYDAVKAALEKKK